MPSDRICLSVAEARHHAELAMSGIGYDTEEAYIVADHAIDAALCGYEYSGLAKLQHPRASALQTAAQADASSARDRGVGTL